MQTKQHSTQSHRLTYHCSFFLWLYQQFLKIKRELHIRHTIPLIEFSGAASPMVLGFFRPVLVLPEGEYSEKELYFILKHELVHVKRGDVYWKLLFMTVNGVHWFNPLIWIMQKEAAMDMELSCDERVTQGAGLEKALSEYTAENRKEKRRARFSLCCNFDSLHGDAGGVFRCEGKRGKRARGGIRQAGGKPVR